MSLLAHACLAAPRMEAERRALDKRIREEALEAARIQQQLRCTWAEAIEIAVNNHVAVEARTDRRA